MSISKTIIYTTVTTSYGKLLKDFFADNQIEFEEKFIDQDDVVRDEMMKESGGFLGVPFTVVTKEDGTKETIVGFDKGLVNKIFGLQ